MHSLLSGLCIFLLCQHPKVAVSFLLVNDEQKFTNMKQNKILITLLASGMAVLTACNNDANNTSGNADSLTNNNTTTDNSLTTSGDYAAYADELERNSAAGRYINARTGQPYQRLNVDRQTGAVTDENNEPVWRYVDKDSWWVYGLDDEDWTWKKLGEAKMENNELRYKDASGNWVTYDARWKTDDDDMDKSWKMKSGDTKIKVDKDGDIKVKDESGKVKYDADDNKIKVDR